MVKCVVKLKNCWIGEKNWCGSIYGPHDYDKETKRQKGKMTKIQKHKKAKIQKDKKTNLF